MKFPDLSTPCARLQTFEKWQSPKCKFRMVDSGFFHQFYKDLVTCFYCGLNLWHWERHDYIDIEHVKYSPNCVFINRKLSRQNKACIDQFLKIMRELDDIQNQLTSISTRMECLDTLDSLDLDCTCSQGKCNGNDYSQIACNSTYHANALVECDST